MLCVGGVLRFSRPPAIHRGMNRKAFLWFPLVVLALLAGGCTSGTKLGGLGVDVVTIRSAQPDLLETEVVLGLRYTNENVVPVGFRGSRHKFYLNGTYIGQAVSNQPVGLAPLSTGTQDVTVMVKNGALLGVLRTLSQQSQASYRIESTLFVTAGEERMEIKSRREGSVDLAGILPVAGGR